MATNHSIKFYEIIIMRQLFIVKEKNDLDPLIKMYELSRPEMAREITFLLIHDAVLIEFDYFKDSKVFACHDDVKARGINSPFYTLDYTQILKLIEDSDKVISW